MNCDTEQINDLLLDLQNLKEKLEFEARLAEAHQPAGSGKSTVEMNVEATRDDTPQELVTPSREVPNAHVASSAEYLLGALNRHRRGGLIALVSLVVILAGLYFGWGQLTGRRLRVEPFQGIKIDRLTTTGKAVRPAISPDGRYLAYAVSEAGQQSLWLRQLAIDSNVQIVPPAPVDYRGITFSRDGGFLYYVRMEPEGVLYRAPTLGGATRRLLSQLDSPITLSPDGRQIAFVRRDATTGKGILIVAQEDGSRAKILAMRKHLDMYRNTGPSWSPDGKLISCAAENYTGSYHSVVGVRIDTGAEEQLTKYRWGAVGQVAWLTDSSGLLVAAAERHPNMMQIWHVAYPSGEVRRITNDLSSYSNISLTADSKTFATIRNDRFCNIWVAPRGEASRAVQTTTGAQREDGVRGLVWTHHGKIVYRSFADGNPNIWIMNSDGTENKQISADANQNLDPTVSPDGRYIAWSSSPGDSRNIWRMELDGSNPKQLTHGTGEWFTQFSPDGKWLVYQELGSGGIDRMLVKTLLDGGTAVRLTDKSSYAPALSPDGKLIAFNYRREPGAPVHIAVMSIEGGPLIKLFEIPGFNDRPIRWMPDREAVAYIVTKGGVSNIWSQPLAGGPPKQSTEFSSHQIFDFAWSRDGRQLALSRGVINSDVAMISYLR